MGDRRILIMALIDKLQNNLKVIHKVKSIPTGSSKLGIHLVDNGGVYVVTKDKDTPINKIVKKIYERSDHYLKEETDNLLQAQKDVIDNGYTTSDSLLQAQINNLQPLNTKKAYLTKASADSDMNPIGDDGDPIGLGQLIVVTSDTTNNGIYRLKNLISGEPTWELVGTLGDLSTYTLSGGSAKTLLQVEDEIAQLAGDTQEVIHTNLSNHIIADEQGNIASMTDSTGTVISKYEEGKLKRLDSLETVTDEIENNSDSFSIIDESGNVVFTAKPEKKKNRLSDYLSDEYVVSQQPGIFKNFPTVVVGLTGTIHVLFCSDTLGHISKQSSLAYAYSTDFGRTWTESIVLQAGLDVNDKWKLHGEPRLIRMSNGEYLLIHSYIDYNTTTDTYNYYQPIAHIINEVGGVLDFANATEALLPFSIQSTTQNHMAFGGGVVEHEEVIYATGYNSNEVFIYKSLDFGRTWTVERLDYGSGAVRGTESTISFVGDRAYIFIRHEDSVYHDTNPASRALVYFTDDFFATMQGGWQIDRSFHGGASLTLPSGSIALIGRSMKGTELSIYRHKDRLIDGLVVSPYSGEWDADYAWICRFEDKYYMVYYTHLPAWPSVQTQYTKICMKTIPAWIINI